MYVRRVNGVPYTLLNGAAPNISHSRQPGSLAYVNIPKDNRKKTATAAFIGILINYDLADGTYVFYRPVDGKVVRSFHARIFEQERSPDTHIGVESLVMCPPGVGFNRNAAHWWVQMVPFLNYPGLDTDRIGAAEKLHDKEVDLQDALSSKRDLYSC